MPWHSRITRQRIQCVFIHRGTVTKVGITVGRPHLKVTLQSIGFSWRVRTLAGVSYKMKTWQNIVNATDEWPSARELRLESRLACFCRSRPIFRLAKSTAASRNLSVLPICKTFIAIPVALPLAISVNSPHFWRCCTYAHTLIACPFLAPVVKYGGGTLSHAFTVVRHSIDIATNRTFSIPPTRPNTTRGANRFHWPLIVHLVDVSCWENGSTKLFGCTLKVYQTDDSVLEQLI